jgi:DNA-directed RNA polymerase subunit E'
MFFIFEVEEIVGVEPREFEEPLGELAMRKLSSVYEGVLDEELGYVIAVVDVEVEEVGVLLPRDPSIYHRARCKLLTYLPLLQEVVEGEVVEITEFGVFVRVGPLDALLHVSQIMDDYLSFDKKHSELVGSKTGWKLAINDRVRARIVAVSISGGKVGLTTRQPYLGKLEWIQQQISPKPAERPKHS